MIGTKDFMDVGTDRGGGWLAAKRLVVWELGKRSVSVKQASLAFCKLELEHGSS